MAGKTIKGLTVEIGGNTTELQKALKKAETHSNSLGRELSDVNKLLKFDPDNVDKLVQKQQILTERVAATKEKLDILKEAEAQVQEQFEKGQINAEQMRAFRIWQTMPTKWARTSRVFKMPIKDLPSRTTPCWIISNRAMAVLPRKWQDLSTKVVC